MFLRNHAKTKEHLEKLCGAYLRNETRKRALRDAAEKPDAEALRLITKANQETLVWMRRARL